MKDENRTLYRLGDVIEFGGRDLMICRHEGLVLQLIVLNKESRGNRWSEPIKVGHVLEITEDEVRLMIGYQDIEIIQKHIIIS